MIPVRVHVPVPVSPNTGTGTNAFGRALRHHREMHNEKGLVTRVLPQQPTDLLEEPIRRALLRRTAATR